MLAPVSAAFGAALTVLQRGSVRVQRYRCRCRNFRPRIGMGNQCGCLLALCCFRGGNSSYSLPQRVLLLRRFSVLVLPRAVQPVELSRARCCRCTRNDLRDLVFLHQHKSKVRLHFEHVVFIRDNHAVEFLSILQPYFVGVDRGAVGPRPPGRRLQRIAFGNGWTGPCGQYAAARGSPQDSPRRWCPACYLRQQCGDAPDEPVQFGDGRVQPGTRRFRQSRVVLLHGQRFRQQPQLFSVAWIQALPQPALFTAIAPQPAFTAFRGTPGLGFERGGVFFV